MGIAPNKLLAKLASGMAKPNGMCTALSAAEVDALLVRLPAARMPGCGGKIGDTFAGAGINSIKDLQVHALCCVVCSIFESIKFHMKQRAFMPLSSQPARATWQLPSFIRP